MRVHTRRFLIAALGALFAIVLLAAPTRGQAPRVTVYFDEALSHMHQSCPGPGVDTLYVVAENFNAMLAAIEYSIDYSPLHNYLVWIGDFDLPLTTIGSSPTGISIAWSTPRDGFSPLLVQKVAVFWQCSGCLGKDVVDVNAHPLFGLRALRWPDLTYIRGWGMKSGICLATPTRETTWGRVKALYNEQSRAP